MTPEMTFECLLVSSNAEVFGTMHRVLRDYSITTRICLTASEAAGLLAEGSTDLIVVEWDPDSSLHLVHEVWKCGVKPRPTIVAVAREDETIPADFAVLRKPVQRESGRRFMQAAYSRMVHDFRRHMRYAVMTQVIARDGNNRTMSVTVTNLGDGGIGLSTKEKLTAGTLLSLSLALPGNTREISIQARVLWTRPYGSAGCEFVRIPPADLEIMLHWLRSRCRIKKPLIDVESIG
jgi:PilZ domain